MSQAKKHKNYQRRSALSFAGADGSLDVEYVLQVDVWKDIEKFEETIAGQVQNVLNEFRDKVTQVTPKPGPSKGKKTKDNATAEKIPKQSAKKSTAKSETKNSTKNSTKNLPGTSSSSALSVSSVSINKQSDISKTMKKKEKNVSVGSVMQISKTMKNLSVQSQHDTDNAKKTTKKSPKHKDKDNTANKSVGTKENVQNVTNIRCLINVSDKLVSTSTSKTRSPKETAIKEKLSEKNIKLTKDNTINKAVGTKKKENVQNLTNTSCLTNVTDKVPSSISKTRSPKEKAIKKKLSEGNMKLMTEDNTINKAVGTRKKENVQNVTNTSCLRNVTDKVSTSISKTRSPKETAIKEKLNERNMKLITEDNSINKSVETIKKEIMQNVTNISCLTNITDEISTSTPKKSPKMAKKEELSKEKIKLMEDSENKDSEDVKEISKISEKDQDIKTTDQMDDIHNQMHDMEKINMTLQKIKRYLKNNDENLSELIDKKELTNNLRTWNMNMQEIARAKDSLQSEKEQTDKKGQCKKNKQITKALKKLSQHMAAVMKEINKVNKKSKWDLSSNSESSYTESSYTESSYTSDSSYTLDSSYSNSSTSTTSTTSSFDSSHNYFDQSTSFRSIRSEEDLEQYNSCTDCRCKKNANINNRTD